MCKVWGKRSFAALSQILVFLVKLWISGKTCLRNTMELYKMVVFESVSLFGIQMEMYGIVPFEARFDSRPAPSGPGCHQTGL